MLNTQTAKPQPDTICDAMTVQLNGLFSVMCRVPRLSSATKTSIISYGGNVNAGGTKVTGVDVRLPVSSWEIGGEDVYASEGTVILV